MEDDEWRERVKLIQQFHNFNTIFVDLIKDILSDRKYVIRQEIIKAIVELTRKNGSEWFFKNILDYLYAFKEDNSYLRRQTPLF